MESIFKPSPLGAENLAAGESKTVLIHFLAGGDRRGTLFTVIQSGSTVFDDEVIRVLQNGPVEAGCAKRKKYCRYFYAACDISIHRRIKMFNLPHPKMKSLCWKILNRTGENKLPVCGLLWIT
jgi:hypothetical protein